MLLEQPNTRLDKRHLETEESLERRGVNVCKDVKEFEDT